MKKTKSFNNILKNPRICCRSAQGIVVPAAAGLLLLSTMLANPVHADGNHGAVPDGGRFTPNRHGAMFPPQPRSIKNVRYLERSSRLSSRAGNGVVTTVLADESVAERLGDRFAYLGTSTRKDKWSGANERQEVLFFSHSWNQTVLVTYQHNRITSIRVTAAGDDQPALGESEKASAIALARAYWTSLGSTLIDGLTGYAIQTFRDDGSPYPTRMTYVSFHTESPEPPLLINWVDLTTQQVVRSEVE